MEFRMMNNAFRRLIQRRIEFRTFQNFLNKRKMELSGRTILDAGCGSGFSTRLISENYKPGELIAFDFMPEQLEIAREKNPYAEYFTGDVTDIDLPDEKFDAVFVFGILHHVPEWRKAIKELYRVLKPGGVLLVEEVDEDGAAFMDRFFKFHHPKEAKFSWQVFSEALTKAEFRIVEQSNLIFNCFRSYMCEK